MTVPPLTGQPMVRAGATSDVIDLMTSAPHAGHMISNRPTDVPRYDLTIRVVMWLDAFWSVAFVLAALVGAAMAIIWTPSDVPDVVVVSMFVSAADLALCGAVTGVLLIARMQRGHYYLPEDLRLPLPAFMRPDLRAPH